MEKGCAQSVCDCVWWRGIEEGPGVGEELAIWSRGNTPLAQTRRGPIPCGLLPVLSCAPATMPDPAVLDPESKKGGDTINDS